MTRLLVALSLLLSVALPLLADSPQIVDVDPVLVDVNGGQLAIIYSGLSRTCVGLPGTCGPFPSIDGQNVTVIGEDPVRSTIVVMAPRHDAGPAVLTLTGTSGDSVSITIHYGIGNEYERVLVPLLPQQLNGANGSLWRVTGVAMNAGPDITNLLAPWTNPAPGISPALVHPHTLPGQVIPLMLDRGPYGDGAFLAIPKFSVESIAFEIRVADISRQSQTLGTEVPVARERNYRKKIVLLDLPNDARYRTMLRVYGFSDDIENIRVRIFGLGDSEPLVDEVRVTSGTIHHAAPPSALPPYYPAYLQLPLELWPILAASGPLRVELTTDNGSLLWAFASISNNDTQQVTLVTPQ